MYPVYLVRMLGSSVQAVLFYFGFDGKSLVENYIPTTFMFQVLHLVLLSQILDA